MPINTAEKRRSAGGTPFLPFLPGVTPNFAKPAAWRQESGWGYSGIPVTPPAAPVAGFIGSPLSGPATLTVGLTDTSTGVITLELFDPGDGTGILTSVPLTHAYVSVGTFSPSLTVSGPGGSNTLTRTNYITVTAPAPHGGLVCAELDIMAAVSAILDIMPAVCAVVDLEEC